MFFYIGYTINIYSPCPFSLPYKTINGKQNFQNPIAWHRPNQVLPEPRRGPIPMIPPSNSNLTWRNSFLALANNSKAHASIWAQIGVESIQVGEWGSNGAVDKSISAAHISRSLYAICVWCEAKSTTVWWNAWTEVSFTKTKMYGLGLGQWA